MTCPYLPGHYSNYYPSSVVSPWYVWFCWMGYPELDVRKFEDGEWAIIHYLDQPLLPSSYKWEWAFTGFKHVEITYDLLKHFVTSIDITKKAFWDREEAKSREVAREAKKEDEHVDDMVTRAHTAIRNNPGLIQRIMKEGMSALHIANIRKHIPNHRM